MGDLEHEVVAAAEDGDVEHNNTDLADDVAGKKGVLADNSTSAAPSPQRYLLPFSSS